MTPTEVEVLEQARCDAMIAADVVALDAMFDEHLCWTHASGKQDGKTSMLQQFRVGSMACFSIRRSMTATHIFGATAIVTGVVEMDAMSGGVRKQVKSHYAGVWSRHDNVRMRLVNWHSGRAD